MPLRRDMGRAGVTGVLRQRRAWRGRVSERFARVTGARGALAAPRVRGARA
jgi:hypothetical protein